MKKKKYRVLSIILFLLAVLLIDVTLVFINLRDKFCDTTIELGTEEVDLKAFVVSKMYLKRSKCLTDINSINLNEVGEYDIEFTYGNKKQKVKLKVVDTTAPEVEFQNLEKGLDYEFNHEDFVVLVKDLSEYHITSDIEELDLKLGQYKVNVIVSDIYGNETSKECILDIKLVHDKIEHELGTPLAKSEILVTEEFGSKELTNEVLSSIDISEIGEYWIKFNYDNKEYKTKVVVQDTLGPEIIVNNIELFIGSKEKKNEDFVKSISDPSGVKDIKYEGTLDFNTLGVQELKITAVDNLGNVSEAVATLTIKDDKVGPVISGLTTITINKGQTIDYLKGVKAIDKRDGECEVTVDTSKVDTKNFGTYYAVYTSKDKSNNVTTKKRKIVVNYDSSDVEEMFNQYYNKYLAGKSILQMTQFIRNNISYVHNRGDNPLYIALVQRKGSCYGHAFMLKKALDKAGYPNYIVNTTDNTHYWNLVYANGVWRHYDSTPGTHLIGPATDAQKLASSGLRGRVWDTSQFPAAN